MSMLKELEELRKRNQAELEKMEEEHRVEIGGLEELIEKKMKELSDASKKLELQKSKQKAELIVANFRQSKEFEKIEKEFRDVKEKRLAAIAEKMAELELVKTEINLGKSNISTALEEEKTVRGLIALVCEVDRLWLSVREEMEPMYMILDSEVTESDKIVFFKMALEDMKSRKKELDEKVDALHKTPNLDSYCNDEIIHTIIKKIGSPLKTLDALWKLAENGKVGDISDLVKEVDGVGEWVDKLRKVHFSPSKTVLSIMTETARQALN